jgi:hydroxymethylbilane synthase
MTIPSRIIRIGTRASALARWQTDYVAALLKRAWQDLTVEPVIITTRGDKVLDTPLPLIGGKGVFTAELEAALLNGEIDLAVHSLKDLPTEDTPGLIVGAIPERGSPNDALISRNRHTLETLPTGAAVGTSSRRRSAQILHRRPDLRVLDIRGNVDTRIRKALDFEGQYDAILLALAGLERLGQTSVISQIVALEDVLPAPGQGALAVQCRDETDSRSLLAPINHPPTEIAVTAERAFLAALGSGCSLPVAAYSELSGDILNLRGRVNSVDGVAQIDVALIGSADLDSARKLGSNLARMALDQGAARLLEQQS